MSRVRFSDKIVNRRKNTRGALFERGSYRFEMSSTNGCSMTIHNMTKKDAINHFLGVAGPMEFRVEAI